MLSSLMSGNFSLLIVKLISSLIVIFITMPIHEFAHGFTAVKLGDNTPRWQGRLTLNPFAHIDYLGALGILLIGIGYAKPVQINARNFKNPKRDMAITALAGPVSNILLAFISLIVYNVFVLITVNTGNVFVYNIANLFYWVASINVSLAVFNLIPVPPLDGSRILSAFLPDKYYYTLMKYEKYIFIALFVLIYAGVLSGPMNLATSGIMTALINIASIPFNF